jgi:hypothetical protein
MMSSMKSYLINKDKRSIENSLKKKNKIKREEEFLELSWKIMTMNLWKMIS